MNKICCIFINHIPELYVNVFNMMKSSVDYIDFYNYNPNWDDIENEFGDIMFKDDFSEYCNRTSGNAVFAAFYFKKYINDKYDYYFIFENDVLFTGDYKILFDELTKNIYDYDAILSERLIKTSDDWFWLENDDYFNLLDGFTKYDCYNQLYTFFCLSNNMIDHIIKRYKDGYYGHQELVLSCILKSYNGNYDYFNDHFNVINSYTKHDIKKYHLLLENTIIHPVKQKIKK